MNYQLVKNDFLPITIKTKDKIRYYDALEEYAMSNNIDPFKDMICELEEKELDFYIKQLNQHNK